MGPQVSVTDAVDRVVDVWQAMAAAGAMSDQTVEKFAALLGRFSRFVDAHGVRDLEEIDAALAESFILARGRSRRGEVSVSAVATQRLRRSVLRAFFRTARGLLLTGADPAMDIPLPDRPDRRIRPLDPDEAGLCRHFAQLTEAATRHAAVVALALSGLHSSEIGHVALADVDLTSGQVRAPGTSRTMPRWCPLDIWAVHTLQRRIDHLTRIGQAAATRAVTLVGSGSGTDAQRQARVCVALRDVLVRAGLGDDPTLRPASITAHAGWMAFQIKGRIEDAARLLGMRSLDRAAELVGYEWQAGNPADPR